MRLAADEADVTELDAYTASTLSIVETEADALDAEADALDAEAELPVVGTAAAPAAAAQVYSRLAGEEAEIGEDELWRGAGYF